MVECFARFVANAHFFFFFFFFFGKEEANLKANVVTIITNLLNGGSYNSFDKFWTQHAWGRLAGIDTPSRQTAADLMIEIGAVIDSQSQLSPSN
jgi:hypothetical protein